MKNDNEIFISQKYRSNITILCPDILFQELNNPWMNATLFSFEWFSLLIKN